MVKHERIKQQIQSIRNYYVEQLNITDKPLITTKNLANKKAVTNINEHPRFKMNLELTQKT